jgi:hypothetical protein
MQQNIHNFQTYTYSVILFLFVFYNQPAYTQYDIRFDKNQLTTLTYGPEKQNGFRVSFALVALFTAGSIPQNGFRLGAGITLSQTVGNWVFSSGLDVYKIKQKFGIGTSFAGIQYDDCNYGIEYYLNKYYQGDKQVSGIVKLHLNDFRILFEDDILAYPFMKFKVYDRYRSAAMEIRYKKFLLGTNVYTADINGMTDVSPDNSKGVYVTGKQLSSPVYLGYTTNDMILRYGINSKAGGKIGQNIWHRLFFNSPDFKSGDYNNHFFQIGVDKPYTLY